MTPGVRGCLVRRCPATIVNAGGLCGFHRDSWEKHRVQLEDREGPLSAWQIVIRFERWVWRSHRELLREQ